MSPKKISHQDITGDRGIALIHSIVGEMGFVWNATGLEAGIDGIIEIRDVATGEMTNLIIQVQSKATAIDFSSETVNGFDYYCKSKDVDYWLGGNAPVILICSKPSTNEAYWVSIKDYFNDLTKRSSNKVHFNKDKNKFDINARNTLIETAKPNDSGVYLAPLPKTENLISNLLPVKYFGKKIYIAETNYRSRKSVWDELKKFTKSNIGGEWILKNKQIISFQDLNEFPWNKICTSEAEEFDSSEWSESDDIERKNDFINLLKLSLAQKLSPDVRYHKDFEYYYFVATGNLKPKELKYKSLVQQTKRAVFQVYRRTKDPTQVSHYRHSAFFGQYFRYNNIWYLEITPSYHFTSDGYRTFLFREDQLTGIKQLERNPAVLGQVVMWAEYLQDKPDLFSQPDPFLQFGELEKFVIETGLDDKSWLKKEEEEEVKTATSPDNQLPLFESSNMNIDFMPEPELDFGVDKHVDIRFGIMNYGTVDFSSPLAPKEIRLGIVGTNESVEGICDWLEKCKGEISAKESKQPNLFPKFPGFRPDIAFQSTIILNDRLHRILTPQTFKDLSQTLSGNEFATRSVDLFFEEFKYLAENSKVDVFLCAVPQSLLEIVDSLNEDNNSTTKRNKIDFHDLLKAKSMSLNVPIQLVIPSTYDDTKRRKQKRKSDQVRKPQDEATRAWNLHTALYYKAKGIAWRLTRMPSDYTTCYVGISFYKTLDGSKLLTSVAQVFNERGEGVIVRGGQAQVFKDDRQVHLDQNASFDLLTSALDSYRTEHKNLPARLVIHKTSTYTPAELDGFMQAAKSMRVDMVDLVSIVRSSARLFRTGSYPPLRGTFLSLDEINHILYTRGSVNFFETYPGMYVPRSLYFRTESTEQTAKFLAHEILSLTKMNWNQTQFDGGDPITIRAAREVSQILKYIPEGEDAKIAPSYRFYM